MVVPSDTAAPEPTRITARPSPLPRQLAPHHHILSAVSNASTGSRIDGSTTSSKTSKNALKGFLSRVFGRKARGLSEVGTEDGEAGLVQVDPVVVVEGRVSQDRVLKKSRSLKKLRPSAPASPTTSPAEQRPRALKHAKSEPALKYLAKSQPGQQHLPAVSMPPPTRKSNVSNCAINHTPISNNGLTPCVQLIDIEADGRLMPRREGIEYMRRLDAHVVVVAAVGAVGVGKSSVLNRIARNKTRFGGEPVLESSQERKKGASMAIVEPWWDHLPSPAADINGTPLPRKHVKVVLIDAPGFTGHESQLKWETRLMALVVLLASTVLIVGRTRMDDQGLAALHALGELPAVIDPATTIESLATTLPNLMWLLLDADDPSGNSDTRLLENLLRLNPPQAPDGDRTHCADQVRSVLTKLFTKQSLHSLAAPLTQGDANANKLPLRSGLPAEDDDPPPARPPSSTFRQQMEKLSKTVAQMAGVKQIACVRADEPAVSLRGRDLANLLTTCCDMLNRDADDGHHVLHLDDIWNQTNDAKWQHLHTIAKQKYDDFMTAIAVPHMPCDVLRLRDRHDECIRKTLNLLRDDLSGIDNRAWRRREAALVSVLGEMDERGKVNPGNAALVDFVVRNLELAMRKCAGVLTKGQEQITKKIADAHYDSLAPFDQDVTRIVNLFHRAARSPELLSSTAIASHLQPFQYQITLQRVGLAQHFSDRARAEHQARLEHQRRDRDQYVLRAAEELRGVQDMIGDVRWRAGEEERLLRESERVVRERLVQVLCEGSGGVNDAAALTAVTSPTAAGPPTAPQQAGRTGMGGMVGAPPPPSASPNRYHQHPQYLSIPHSQPPQQQQSSSTSNPAKPRGRARSRSQVPPPLKINTAKHYTTSAAAFMPRTPPPFTCPVTKTSIQATATGAAAGPQPTPRSKSASRASSRSPAAPLPDWLLHYHLPHHQHHHPSSSGHDQQHLHPYAAYLNPHHHPHHQHHQHPPVPPIPTIYAPQHSPVGYYQGPQPLSPHHMMQPTSPVQTYPYYPAGGR
ncbi:hypothetical protein DFJ77DRAFT_468716 [Powellomyces hirtus]|nr:hypothetical protein DFJ77DRAFT_468716 [Powellomyces hirtus]